ncbi:hypothetical protein FRC10_011937 [Ceratobasidium sp. 414]|nr:hypothetical protein FRC10_011937 [Ceratobasidium sp. 414]
MHHLFINQELVAAVCSGLYAEYLLERDIDDDENPSKEFERTALVSTHFFHGMLPYIWESVALLDLFKRGLIPAKITNGVQVRVSQPISRETMSRFHFYAPYIKVLNVPIGSYAAVIGNWKPLAVYSKDNELLPNLIELKCGKFDPQALSVFLLPSTRKLTIDPPEDSQQGLDMASTMRLLERTAHRCTNLRSLEFHPTTTPVPPETLALLSSFKNLRRLVSTPIVLQSTTLQVVAQLPHLGTLSIESEADDGLWDPSLCEQVPADGFPALSDLTLRLETLEDATRFWELIPLGNLKKLDLTILVAGDNSELIPTLCRASPQITEFRLGFDEAGGDDEWVYEISADMFEHLACLPIESCSFDGAKLNFDGAWAKFASSWPSLRSIKCLAQQADLEHLLLLSSNLPKLEAIECGLDMDYAADAIESNWSPVGQPFYPQLRHLTFRKPDIGKIMRCGLEDRGRKSEIRDLAKFLAYFWPKLSIEAVKEEPEEVGEGYGREYYKEGKHQELLASKDASFSLFKDLVLSYVQVYHRV